MRREQRLSLSVGLVVAALAGSLGTSAWAGDDTPVRISIGVSGLGGDAGRGLERTLQNFDSVSAARVDSSRATVQVKAERTLRLSELLSAIDGVSTRERPVEADRAGVGLVGTATITVDGIGDVNDDDVLDVLKSIPNVANAEGSGGRYEVTFQGSRGSSVGEVERALQARFAQSSVRDVAWTAPKEEKSGGDG